MRYLDGVRRTVSSFVVGWALVHSGACASDGAVAPVSAEAGVGDAAEGARVRYEPHVAGEPYEPLAGGPTDEALAAVLAAKPVEAGAKAAVLVGPPVGIPLDRRAPPRFEWRAAHADASPVPRARDHARGGAASPAPWGPMRSARAHNPPFSGTVYLLVLSTPKARGVERVFTAGTSFTPDAASWANVIADGGPVTVELRTALLTDNRVDADGGPFDAAPTTFTLAP